MSQEIEKKRDSGNNVVSLASFRQKKLTVDDLSRGREPLYVSHLTGKVTGNPHARESQADFGDRLQRIRTSLERINRLMADLKKMSHNADESIEKSREDASSTNRR